MKFITLSLCKLYNKFWWKQIQLFRSKSNWKDKSTFIKRSAHSPTFREKLHFGKRASLHKSWTPPPISAFHCVNPFRYAGKEHFIPKPKSWTKSAKWEFHLIIWYRFLCCCTSQKPLDLHPYHRCYSLFMPAKYQHLEVERTA